MPRVRGWVLKQCRILVLLVVCVICALYFSYSRLSDINSYYEDDDDQLGAKQRSTLSAQNTYIIPTFRRAQRNETLPYQRIPRVVYQTGYSQHVIERVYNNTITAHANNPEYDFRYYDNRAVKHFLRRHFGGEVYQAFRTLQMGAARADLWRYCVLYKRGGVYIDLDAGIYGPLKHKQLTAQTDALLGYDIMGNLINWFMMFTPHHPFLYYVIQLCTRRILAHEKSVFTATGPTLLTDAYLLYYHMARNVQEARQLTPDQKKVLFGQQIPLMVVPETTLNEIGLQFKYHNFEEHDLYATQGLKHYAVLGGELKITPDLYKKTD